MGVGLHEYVLVRVQHSFQQLYTGDFIAFNFAMAVVGLVKWRQKEWKEKALIYHHTAPEI